MTSYGSMPPTEISQFSAFSASPSAVSARSAFTTPSGFSASAAPSAAAESAFSQLGFSNAGSDVNSAMSESRPGYPSNSEYSQPGFTYPDSSAAPTGTNGRRGGRRLHEVFDEDYLQSKYRQHQEIIGDGISYQDFRNLEDKTTVMYSDSEAPKGEGYK